MDFEWDGAKELENLKKHKVSFQEALSSFFDVKGVQLDDLSHSRTEKRFYWIGKSKNGRVLTTYFTKRGKNIRIIGSAEWRKFRRLYYEATENE